MKKPKKPSFLKTTKKSKKAKATAAKDKAEKRSLSLIAEREGGGLVTDNMTEYGLYVLEERATPRIEDGLKPVQRRILWAAHQLPKGARFVKSAKIVGDTMANFHPHGNSAIYEALVNMHHMPLQLIEGYGNFGGGGQSAAADRYTEARLSPQVRVLAMDTPDLDCVPFAPNYDNSKQQPVFLPMRLPTLVLNGSQSIGVGQSTHLPPHNVKEVIDAVLEALATGDYKQASRRIKGPDYGQGQVTSTRKEIRAVELTGEGTLEYSCQYAFESTAVSAGKRASSKNATSKRLTITSLAPEFNRNALLEKLGKLQDDGVIVDFNDETTKKGDQIVVTFENAAAVRQRVLPLLKKKLSYRYNVLLPKADVNVSIAAYSGKVVNDLDKVSALEDPRLVQPAQVTLPRILEVWVNSRVATVRVTLAKRLADLSIDLEREEGKLIARQNIDVLVAIVKSGEDMVEALVKKLKLTRMQAETVAAMRVDSLQKSSQERIVAHIEDLKVKIGAVKEQLSDVPAVVVAQVKEIEAWYVKNAKHLLVRGTTLASAADGIASDDKQLNALRAPLKYVAWRPLAVGAITAEPSTTSPEFKGKPPMGVAEFRDMVTVVYADKTAVQLAANGLDKSLAKRAGKSFGAIVGIIGDAGASAMYVVDDYGRGCAMALPANVAMGEDYAVLKSPLEAKVAVGFNHEKDTLVLRLANGELVTLPPGSVKPGTKAVNGRGAGRMLSKEIKGLWAVPPDCVLVNERGEFVKLPTVAEGERCGRRELPVAKAKSLFVVNKAGANIGVPKAGGGIVFKPYMSADQVRLSLGSGKAAFCFPCHGTDAMPQKPAKQAQESA